jgi:GntR family transcriptional regulator
MPVPLYHRVFGSLQQRLLDGTYEVGQQLPTEDELAAEYGVSRATIRQAVGQLVQEGLVSRKQGRGTFVLPRGEGTLGQRFSGSLDDLLAETRRAKIRDVELERRAALPARVATQLGLAEPTGTIVRRTRLMDGEPFAFTVNYLAPRYGALLDKRRLGREGLMHQLGTKGVRFSGATQSIRAQLADLDVAARLGIEVGAAVLFVERLLCGEEREPVEVVRSWYRGDAYEYTVAFESAASEPSLGRHFA